MSEGPALDDVERELDRVVDRLNSMPLARVVIASEDVHRTAEALLQQTRLLGAAIPPGAALPPLGPQGLGALIAVIGNDWLDAARASSGPDCGPALDALVTLRRALP